jgi:hypothetical protein
VACRQACEIKGKLPLCETDPGECENEPPPLWPANELFECVYERIRMARGAEGFLQYEPLSLMMSAMGLTPQEQADTIEKAIAVEAVISKVTRPKTDA